MHTTPPNHSSAPDRPHGVDKRSFLKYVKYIGRAYRRRAVELVRICRTFMQAQNQNQAPDSYYDLRRPLQLVDDALMSATEAKRGTSEKANKAFDDAVSELVEYGKKKHPTENVAGRIKEAEEADKSSLKVLNILREKFHPLEERPTTIVNFLIHKSLPDKRPTVVTQALCSESNQNEILWNFSRYEDGRRLTLKQNPHFYKVLPTSPESYGDKFITEPTDTYLHEKINVLTDNLGQAGRVFLKTAKKTCAFGNVWVPKDAIIFKGVCGTLEGESRVGKAIQDTPNLWCFTEPPPSPTSRSSPSSNRSSPSPTTTATPTTSSTGLLLTDWRDPIRQMLRSPDVNIRISTKPPINSIPGSPVPSSPIPQSGLSSRVGSLPPADTPQSRSPISELHRVVLSPRSPAHPSPEPPEKLSSHPTAVPAHSTRAPLPTPLLPQPTSVASPSTSSVTPARKTLPLSDTHPRGVSREDGTFLGDKIPSQPLIAGVTVTPHAPSHEAKVAGHVPSQRPDPSYQHKVATRVVTPGPLPQQDVPTTVPIVKVPAPEAQKRKKNWFQRHVYDYAN